MLKLGDKLSLPPEAVTQTFGEAARVERICEHCFNVFGMLQCATTRGRGRYCSKACFDAARRRRVALTCEHCGTEFHRKASEVTHTAFCARPCYDAHRAAHATSYPKKGNVHVHRLIGAALIGRALLPGEIVHHRDENKRNSLPDNLEVLPRAEHSRQHSTGRKHSAESVRRRSETIKRTLKAKREMQCRS